MTVTMRSNLFDFVRGEVAKIEHDRNLHGKTRETCEACDGRGHNNDGRIDHDSYGSLLVSPTECRDCRGQGAFEVDCEPSKQLAAIDREIAKLRELKRRVRKKARSGDGQGC